MLQAQHAKTPQPNTSVILSPIRTSVILFFLCTSVILFGVACNEGDSPETESSGSQSSLSDGSGSITTIDTSNTSSDLDNYEQSSFSTYVYFHKTEEKTLVDYNFFPVDKDVCQQATYNADTNPNGCQTDMTVIVPCESVLSDDDLLLIQSSEESSCDDIVVSFSDADFTLDGLVFATKSTISNFNDDFGFTISSNGFQDSEGNSLSFSSNDITLEDVTDLISDSSSS